MQNYLNEKVLIRTSRAGVFFGTLSNYDDTTRTAEITNTRRIYYWDGAASLSQMATEGVTNPEACKFTVIVPQMMVMEVIEVIPCSYKAIISIESVKIWKR